MSRKHRFYFLPLLAALCILLIGCVGDVVSGETGKTQPPAAETDSISIITPAPDGTPALTGITGEPVADETQMPLTPEPTVDPYQLLYERADTSMMKDIVNILLVGVDYSTERETWNGKKEWHSDVMMVLAVNFDENRADLISLPRDTYAEIPNVKGIYKLNASLNCGGGLYNDDGSFNPRGMQKVLDAAEWMLGGIEIDYYYAVTMTSLKDLVDLCGGLEYQYGAEGNGHAYLIRSDGKNAVASVDGRKVYSGPCGARIITDESGTLLGKKTLE